MKTILTALLLCCVTCLYAQQELHLHDSLQRSINFGDSEWFTIKTKKGNFYKLLVMQQGIDLEIHLKNAAGKDTVFDSPNGTDGPEPIEFLADANTTTLTVKPLGDTSNTKQGNYYITYKQIVTVAAYKAILQQIEANKNELVQWIKQNAVPLKTVQSGNGFEDLAAFKPLLENKRIVAMGEATHGTKEFFQMKHRMLEYLVTQLGFTVFAIEASYGRCRYINDYILTGKGSLDTAVLVQGFTTWSTEEVKAMIEWMRKYNAANPPVKVQFVGFDLQVNDAVESAISKYYAKVDPAKQAMVDTLLKQVDKEEMNGGIFSGDTSIRNLIAPTEKLLADFIEQQGEYILKSSIQEYDEMLWNEKILHQYLISYSYQFGDTTARGTRDYYMAQNILNWLNEFPAGTKMMVWAHNGHVAKDYLNSVSVPSMGSYLKAALKDDYYVIGFDFYKGKFQSNDVDLKDSPGWEEQEVGEAPGTNMSSYFVQAGLGNSILDFTQTPQTEAIKEWLNDKTIGTYSMGSQFSKSWPTSQFIAPMKLQRAFDAIIFIKESTRAVPVKYFSTDALYKF